MLVGRVFLFLVLKIDVSNEFVTIRHELSFSSHFFSTLFLKSLLYSSKMIQLLRNPISIITRVKQGYSRFFDDNFFFCGNCNPFQITKISPYIFYFENKLTIKSVSTAFNHLQIHLWLMTAIHMLFDIIFTFKSKQNKN